MNRTVNLSTAAPATLTDIRNRVYAGVLGKIIGVSFGRPVEGWYFEQIRDRFGEIQYFVNKEMGLPYSLPDDDISGTFSFFRAIEDNDYPLELTAEAVGQTWLNYIIEDRTILWWGGLGRSTEHTAFLNLKQGIEAPASGSYATNGGWIPEQIGAQIFIDAFAMACPGDPERAARMIRRAASVSHDGLALDAAALVGAMEALAFVERDIDTLIEEGLRQVSDERLRRMIGDLREQCARHADWHDVRQWLADNHSYNHYEGPCHMVPNHGVLLMAFIKGGDDLAASLRIATNAGWDTDCNAGNVGCLNGTRLGLEAFDAGPDLRSPVADFMYVVNADGASGITDAVQETRRIMRATTRMSGTTFQEPATKYAFELPGSVQGFAACAAHPGQQAVVGIGNSGDDAHGRALRISLHGLATGVTGSVSTPVFVEPYAPDSAFAMLASPTLYSGQTVTAVVSAPVEGLRGRIFVLYYDEDDAIQRLAGAWADLPHGETTIDYLVPPTNGQPLYHVGIEFASDRRFDGDVALLSMDWTGAPERFDIGGTLLKSIWKLTPFSVRAWVSSARHFAPAFMHTFCVSHVEDNGVVTTGSRDWDDYSVHSRLDFARNDGGGLVARARGHRRYYAGILRGSEAQLILRYDRETRILASAPFAPGAIGWHDMTLSVVGDRLSLSVDGTVLVTASDVTLRSGGAGFMVNTGSIVADGFHVIREDGR